MYHVFLLFYAQKSRPLFRRLFVCLVLAGLLALLVGHAAGGLACGLAGSLALAAAAVLSALAKVAGLDRLDSFHENISNNQIVSLCRFIRQNSKAQMNIL